MQQKVIKSIELVRKILYNQGGKIVDREYQEKRLLTPKYDVVFQALFGVKGSEEILGELLSSLLGRKVENVQLNENQILTKEYPD